MARAIEARSRGGRYCESRGPVHASSHAKNAASSSTPTTRHNDISTGPAITKRAVCVGSTGPDHEYA